MINIRHFLSLGKPQKVINIPEKLLIKFAEKIVLTVLECLFLLYDD